MSSNVQKCPVMSVAHPVFSTGHFVNCKLQDIAPGFNWGVKGVAPNLN